MQTLVVEYIDFPDKEEEYKKIDWIFIGYDLIELEDEILGNAKDPLSYKMMEVYNEVK